MTYAVRPKEIVMTSTTRIKNGMLNMTIIIPAIIVNKIKLTVKFMLIPLTSLFLNKILPNFSNIPPGLSIKKDFC